MMRGKTKLQYKKFNIHIDSHRGYIFRKGIIDSHMKNYNDKNHVRGHV